MHNLLDVLIFVLLLNFMAFSFGIGMYAVITASLFRINGESKKAHSRLLMAVTNMLIFFLSSYAMWGRLLNNLVSPYN